MKPQTQVNIYHPPSLTDPASTSIWKAATQQWENFHPSQAVQPNSNRTLSEDLILAKVRLDAIESDLVCACSSYNQLCQELDLILWQNQQQGSCSLTPERDNTCQEILAVIHEICRLELEKMQVEYELSDLDCTRHS